ncbi:MAG: DJ-1/PfpI family protein [Acidaminococcales bacterium]|jgi:transcriptional regulator GlxA family with amidase domain|nr:DJ-1/PfpI family protein [Acidaminococcales bacterium]
MRDFNIVLFEQFETLDAFGPAEIIGKLPEMYNLGYFSPKGGAVTSSQNLKALTRPLKEINGGGILLIPGGMGTRNLVRDEAFIEALSCLARAAEYVLTVCTGSALLAKTGLLDGKKATSNKKAFDWVCAQNARVNWQRRARWTVDGRIYTASGISAGMDMALGFIAQMHGGELAGDIAGRIEYVWNADKENDPFALS